MVDPDRLSAAYETARCDLLAESTPAGYWNGQLSSSPLATACAISALAIVERHVPTAGGRVVDERRECALSELIVTSLRWLARKQNDDGGWSDTVGGASTLAATLLARAAFALTCVPAGHAGLLERADAYLKSHGSVGELKRQFGKRDWLSVAVSTNAALGALVPWRQVPSVRFELACLPRSWWRWLSRPTRDPITAAEICIGHARQFHRPSRNPITRAVRRYCSPESLQIAADLQAPDGGLHESVPLVSFAVSSLASTDRMAHPLVVKGVEFLLSAVRPDGSWPLSTGLATWNTSSAVQALAAAGEDPRELACLDWLLERQLRHTDPRTGAAAGGWSWTAAAGTVPDVDDTAAALLALAAWQNADASARNRILPAAALGVRWLLDAQNSDGGWPLFAWHARGGPAEASASDLTAHALRALIAWRVALAQDENLTAAERNAREARIAAAVESACHYLSGAQRSDGAWLSSRFGNLDPAAGTNPVYGTAQVLLALRDAQRLETTTAQRGLDWLISMQQMDGSWGGASSGRANSTGASVEETALAIEAILSCTPASCAPAQQREAAAEKALTWLVDAVEANRYQAAAPIGLHFGKFRYAERLYPLVMSVAALGQALRRAAPRTAISVAHSGKP